MRIRSTWAILLACLALLGASPVYAQGAPVYFPTAGAYGTGTPWLEGWAGFGGSNNWYGGWAGVNYAFNHNVWSDGFLLRVEGGGGHYDYTNTTVLPNGLPVGFVNATYGTGSVLLGYRKTIPGMFVSTTVDGFVGAEYQQQNNPDPTADVTGHEWGVKFIGDIYSRINQYQDFWGFASFSSAFDTWLVIARPGFLLPTVAPGTELWIGPDMSVFGNGHGWLVNASSCHNANLAVATGGLGSCKFDEGRIGGSLHIVIPSQPLFGDWIIAGGYRKPLLANGGPDGYYAQIGLNFRLQ
jgi:hypothetical protein